MKHKTREQLIAFELRIRDLFAEGELPFLVHLAGGNEDHLIDIFAQVNEGDWILASHRAHYHWLLAGGGEAELEKEIRECRSMFLFNKRVNFLSSSVLAGTCGIAAGVALALKMEGSKSKVWCFVGDGGEDEGHFYEAAIYVEGRDLPCTFVVEDNDRSVDTNKAQRRGPNCHWKPKLKHVLHYEYTPTFPHGGAGLTQMIEFKPEVVRRFSKT